jgi:hypothetical protein
MAVEGQATLEVSQDIELADLEALVSDLTAEDMLERPSVMCEISAL